MASTVPKPKEQRINRHPPRAGEWIDLPALTKPILPPADRTWSPRARRMWAAWRRDPATSQYGPADIALIRELAQRYEELSDAAQMVRIDNLGLSPKGRQDRRWRLPQQTATIAAQPKVELRRLRVVSDAVAQT